MSHIVTMLRAKRCCREQGGRGEGVLNFFQWRYVIYGQPLSPSWSQDSTGSFSILCIRGHCVTSFLNVPSVEFLPHYLWLFNGRILVAWTQTFLWGNKQDLLRPVLRLILKYMLPFGILNSKSLSFC